MIKVPTLFAKEKGLFNVVIVTVTGISAIMETVNNYSSGDDVTFLQTDIYKVTSTAGHR